MSASLLAALLLGAFAHAQIPQILNYPGRVIVGAVEFEGAGLFKFALMNSLGVILWSNDGTSGVNVEPAAAVSIPVSKGHYSVLLGDTTLANMAAIPASVFSIGDVRLRVWFNNGIVGSQQLSPDQRLAPSAFAITAATVPDGAITPAKLAAGAVTAASIAPGAVGGAQLASGAVAVNLAASGQSVVPSGGTIFSSQFSDGTLLNTGYVKLGKMDTGDVWEERAGGSLPAARYGHTAIWTGSEMIVWGGFAGAAFNDGGRYNPAANTWTPISTTSAPTARQGHSAVWTGSQMIVWGGGPNGGYTNDGGRYSPASNTWASVTTTGAPTVRSFHTPIWTGSEMIVWGGLGGGGFPAVALNDGARYNPNVNSWPALSGTGAPSARYVHTAVWTGSDMIVFGGYPGGVGANALNDGARYSVAGNTWTSLNPAGAPSGRMQHTAVWTGSEMIVWAGHTGGFGGGTLSSGARYNPLADSWTATGTSGAPGSRYLGGRERQLRRGLRLHPAEDALPLLAPMSYEAFIM